MDVSVITVTWNSAALVKEQVASVFAGCEHVTYEQIIIDNGSTDDTVSLVTQHFPNILLIANAKNQGFSAANIQGYQRSSGKYLLFLNPDMRVSPLSIDKIVSWMDTHTDVGIVSPMLVDEHGMLNWDATPRRFPRVWEQVCLLLKVHHIFPSLLNKYHMKDFDPTQEQDVDSVRGAFMLVRRDVIDALGWPFDPRYFIWYEDVDICREVKRLKYRVVYTPIITCVDYVGQSFKQHTSLWKQKAFSLSMLQYFQKWEPWWKWMWIAVCRPIGIFLVWLRTKVT